MSDEELQLDLVEWIDSQEEDERREHYEWQTHVSLAYDNFEYHPELKRRYFDFTYWRSLDEIERKKVFL